MEVEEESKDTETSVRHINSEKSQCPECDENRKRYIQIIDVDKYVNTLNDLD